MNGSGAECTTTVLQGTVEGLTYMRVETRKSADYALQSKPFMPGEEELTQGHQQSNPRESQYTESSSTSIRTPDSNHPRQDGAASAIVAIKSLDPKKRTTPSWCEDIILGRRLRLVGKPMENKSARHDTHLAQPASSACHYTSIRNSGDSTQHSDHQTERCFSRENLPLTE